MSNNSDIIYHISAEERNNWNKCIDDLAAHIGSGGVNNHRMGDGTIPGFSTNDFTNNEKSKLAGIDDGALNNPHPETHPYTMITGLANVASSGSYTHLVDVPETFIAGGGDSDTVGGIRVTINSSSPSNPQEDKEIWINTSNFVTYVYKSSTWVPLRAAFA